MSATAKIPSTYWPTIRVKLEANKIHIKLVAIYLLTSPYVNNIGIYYLPFHTIAHELDLTVEQAADAIYKLEGWGVCEYDEYYQFVWIKKMAMYMHDSQPLNLEQKRNVKCEFKNLPSLNFRGLFYSYYHHYLGLSEDDK